MQQKMKGRIHNSPSSITNVTNKPISLDDKSTRYCCLGSRLRQR